MQPYQRNTRKKIAIWLLVGPSAVFMFSIGLYALASSLTPEPTGNQLFAQPSPLVTILNVFTYLAGATAIVTWLPGIVVGIVLIVKKDKK